MEGRGGPRIAFVGGGSYQWGPKIIQDVALNEELRGGSLVLHDINGEALEDMYEWGIRALDVAQADLKLEKTQRLEGALSGADFVVLSISTGGLDATALDLEIPARYGFPYDLLEGAKGVQLAELGLRSWRERRWLEVPELEPSRTPEKEYGRA